MANNFMFPVIWQGKFVRLLTKSFHSNNGGVQVKAMKLNVHSLCDKFAFIYTLKKIAHSVISLPQKLSSVNPRML